jgi:mannose-1-phosphate guanylyltransferase
MLSACECAVKAGETDLAFFWLAAEPFASAPSLSIDHTVIKHTRRTAVVLVDMA